MVRDARKCALLTMRVTRCVRRHLRIRFSNNAKPTLRCPCCWRPGVAGLSSVTSGQGRRETERQSAHRLGSALRREPRAKRLAPAGAPSRRSPYGAGPRFSARLCGTVSELLAGTRSGPGRGPGAARVFACEAKPRAPRPLPPSRRLMRAPFDGADVRNLVQR
jgi:hypothetical protein